jgi:hypothetical protein
VRYAFDVARVHADRSELDDAVVDMLEAERLAPNRSTNHVMSRQIIADLRRMPGRRSNGSRGSPRRVEDSGLMSLDSTE